jgi:2-polyprenyl-3-methyl-5-hydroxy-6-metoxy-1,4-benzoquinol methylase
VRLQQTLYTSKNPTRRWLHTTRYQWIRDAIGRHAGQGGRALEAGPGSGIYLPLLAELFTEVVAVDIEEEYLAGLRGLAQRHANISLAIDDITRSRLPDRSFDLVLCTEVVEHLTDSAAALRELHRLLKPGGILVLSTPQPLSPLELAAKVAFLPGIERLVRLIYREPVLPLGHINLLSEREVTTQLHQAGFQVRERFKSGLYVPLFAEFWGEGAVRTEKWLEAKIRGGSLDFLLWTQYYVAVA